MTRSRVILKNTSSLGAADKAKDVAYTESSKRRKDIVRLSITAIILLSMMLTLYVWQATKIVEIKLRISRTEKVINDLQSLNSDLNLEISKGQSLEKIEKIARDDLGMINPQKRLYLVMPNYQQKTADEPD